MTRPLVPAVLAAAASVFLFAEHSVARNLEEVLASGELRVLLLEFEESPYFAEGGDGKALGFDVDLLERFARGRGLRLSASSSRNVEEILDRVASGEFDVGAGGITRTDERTATVSFTSEVTPQRHVVSTWRRPPVGSVEDLLGLRVATASGSSWEVPLDEIGHPEDRRVSPPRSSPTTYVELLRGGEADVAVTGLVFSLLMRRHDSGIGLGLLLGEKGSHGWVVAPGNVELRAELDRVLAESREDGFWDRRLAAHFGSDAVALFRRAAR